MAKLRDLVNVDINRDTIKIQGAKIPVIFTFTSFPYLEEAYGKPYHVFEKDLNLMMKKGKVVLGKKEVRLMYALIYSMIRSGGTDATVSEVEGAIPLSDLPDIFQVAFRLFNNQIFQAKDAQKIKTEKKS
ncbi:hypothetical protein D1B31_16295 [Neobacillus notoginsengisoli]|uniref:Uncharacterized protein n=1 Tax=Neobacillus notoginsengisoli TaxID=1578198 RepID=A0A417YR40_9BACI|nr:hypothetical protein [Neobacillus notoginsengisoli]RHW37324.1 hypothetical protein D1B31_16295 [Neobacillus notoginsengisoli]